MKFEKIDQFSQKLIDSYNLKGGVNHISGPSLPSRESIEQILINIESIMFPGFQSDETIDEYILGYRTREKLNLIFKDLYSEIKKSMCFKLQSENQCNCSDCSVQNIDCSVNARNLTDKFMSTLTDIRSKLLLDAESALAGDPAAASMEEVILSYPGLKTVVIYRIAHELHELGIPLMPRMMSEYAHSQTGIDIHPGASIGRFFFIDHGTGVVIGETTVIGDNVKIYQGVTLGALSVKKEEANIKRHPTIEDGVTIYAGATILGGETVVGAGTTIGGNVWIIKSIKPNSRIYNRPLDYITKN